MLRILVVLSALVLGSVRPAFADHLDVPPGSLGGAVFVATNAFDQVDPFPEGLGVTEAVGNEIVMYHKATDGTLTLQGRFPTGGQGAGPGTFFRGDALGAGNSLQLSNNQRWLIAANAGSNELSVFHVDPTGLTLVDKVLSGGFFPNSVAIHKNLVYVLNAGDSSAFPGGFDGNITGFELDHDGHLTPLAGSTRGLAANGNVASLECQTQADCRCDDNLCEMPEALVNPTQVSFTPRGDFLVVTIKDGGIPGLIQTGNGRILVYAVGRDGRPSAQPVITETDDIHQILTGQARPRGPFAFSIDRNFRLFVTDFIGGAGLTGTVTAYDINPNGSLSVITPPPVDNLQVDSCWNAIGGGGRFLYTANFGSNTISSYTIGRDGSLTLLEGIAATTSEFSVNIDIGTDGRGDFLYNVLPGVGGVAGWAINDDGSLKSLGEFPGLEDTPDLADGPDSSPPFGPGGSPAGIAIADF